MQPLILQVWFLERVDPSEKNQALQAAKGRFNLVFSLVEKRLSEAPHLAGPELTAADIMMVFSLTTIRLFNPYDLAPYPNILAYLQRIGARPAYRREIQKTDPDMTPLLGAIP